MNKEEVIKLWKELGVVQVIFEFSCGGDSMNDTSIHIYNSFGIIENKEIYEYFDTEIYNAVDFYVDSDGVYLGEYGEVTITLIEEEGESYFQYDKASTEEYNVFVTHSFPFNLKEEYKAFIKKYVNNIRIEGDTSVVFDFKIDFIITESIQNLIDSLRNDLMEEIVSNIESLESSYDGDIELRLSITNIPEDLNTFLVTLNFNHRYEHTN